MVLTFAPLLDEGEDVDDEDADVNADPDDSAAADNANDGEEDVNEDTEGKDWLLLEEEIMSREEEGGAKESIDTVDAVDTDLLW